MKQLATEWLLPLLLLLLLLQ